MSQTLQALAEFTAARLVGDGNIEIKKVASLANAQTGDLVFVESDRHLEDALTLAAPAPSSPVSSPPVQPDESRC